MSRLIDLAGKRFGALLVVGRAPDSGGRPAWLCRCDCGAEKVVLGENLRGGRVTSCGCGAGRGAKLRGRVQDVQHVDYTGKTFGELTGVKRLGVDRWLWRCSCGREVAIRASSVVSGKTVSCGHVLSEAARRKIEVDNVLGHVDGTSLSVIRGIMRGTVRSTNTSGVTGVRAKRRADGTTAWEARIVYQRKTIHIGTFDTLEEAAEARKEAEKKYFGGALKKNEQENEW